MATAAPRWPVRKDEPVPFHLRLLDDDLDRQDEILADIAKSYKRIQATLYTLVVAIATASLMLAANVVSGR